MCGPCPIRVQRWEIFQCRIRSFDGLSQIDFPNISGRNGLSYSAGLTHANKLRNASMLNFTEKCNSLIELPCPGLDGGEVEHFYLGLAGGFLVLKSTCQLGHEVRNASFHSFIALIQSLVSAGCQRQGKRKISCVECIFYDFSNVKSESHKAYPFSPSLFLGAYTNESFQRQNSHT